MRIKLINICKTFVPCRTFRMASTFGNTELGTKISAILYLRICLLGIFLEISVGTLLLPHSKPKPTNTTLTPALQKAHPF
jgi:hypothetical protein